MFLCFVDYQKAFDNVRWDKLWQIIINMGVPKHLVVLVKNLYVQGHAVVRIENQISGKCNISKRVRQGCVLSPLLFNIYSKFVMRAVLDEWHGGVSVGGVKISNLRFADNTVLIAKDQPEMEVIISRLEQISSKHGLRIKYHKTKMMIIDRELSNRPEIRNISGCQVIDHYIYLGADINNIGNCEHEIQRRIQLARSAMSQLERL